MPLIRSTRMARPQKGSFHVWAKATEGTSGGTVTESGSGRFMEGEELPGRTTILRRVMITEWTGTAYLTVGVYVKALNEFGEGWTSWLDHETPPAHRGRSLRGYYLRGELHDLKYRLLGQISGKFEKTDFYAVQKILLYAYRHYF